MRTITFSLILAFTAIMSSVSIAGSGSNGVPNAGLFVINPASVTLVASR